MEIIVVAHNIRSAYNVGAILRTAEGFGVRQVVLSGYTPRVHDGRLLPHLRDKLDKQIAKTALGAEEMVDIYSSGDIFSDILRWKDEGYKVMGLENNVEDGRMVRLDSLELAEKIGEKIVLVLGEEVGGIAPELREKMDVLVEIPMMGRKESFNVSVATGVALYGLLYR